MRGPPELSPWLSVECRRPNSTGLSSATDRRSAHCGTASYCPSHPVTDTPSTAVHRTTRVSEPQAGTRSRARRRRVPQSRWAREDSNLRPRDYERSKMTSQGLSEAGITAVRKPFTPAGPAAFSARLGPSCYRIVDPFCLGPGVLRARRQRLLRRESAGRSGSLRPERAWVWIEGDVSDRIRL